MYCIHIGVPKLMNKKSINRCVRNKYLGGRLTRLGSRFPLDWTKNPMEEKDVKTDRSAPSRDSAEKLLVVFSFIPHWLLSLPVFKEIPLIDFQELSRKDGLDHILLPISAKEGRAGPRSPANQRRMTRGTAMN